MLLENEDRTPRHDRPWELGWTRQ